MLRRESLIHPNPREYEFIMEMVEKCEGNKNSNEDFITIKTWEEYSIQCHGDNKVNKQFDNLLMDKDTGFIQKSTVDCPHNHFKNPQVFLQLIHGYINNKPRAANRVNTYDHNVECQFDAIKAGICIGCIHRFIIKTNGLNDIYVRWEQNTEYLTYCLKRFRFEFNNTAILISHPPLFKRAILLKSNIKCLAKLFRLFFITYLKETNLNEYIIENTSDIDDPVRLWHSPNWKSQKHQPDFLITSTNINICHGFEHSLCSLSTNIMSVLPLLKLHHIKYLFIDDTEMKNVVEIIDSFLKSYCNLPHIKLYQPGPNMEDSMEVLMDIKQKTKYKEWREMIRTNKDFAEYWPYKDINNEPVWITKHDVTVQRIFDVFVAAKHPILQRIMAIISSLYLHFRHCFRILKKKVRTTGIEHGKSDFLLLQQMNQERKKFERLIYQNSTKTQGFNMWDGMESSDRIWNLVDCFVCCSKSNRFYRNMNHNKMQCAGCNRTYFDPDTKSLTELKICKGCQLTYYCSRKCQKYDWSRHKHREICNSLNSAVS